jgi:hypothetical protein
MAPGRKVPAYPERDHPGRSQSDLPGWRRRRDDRRRQGRSHCPDTSASAHWALAIHTVEALRSSGVVNVRASIGPPPTKFYELRDNLAFRLTRQRTAARMSLMLSWLGCRAMSGQELGTWRAGMPRRMARWTVASVGAAMTANRATASARTSLLRGTTESELEARRLSGGRAPRRGCGGLDRFARSGNSLALALPLTHSRRP